MYSLRHIETGKLLRVHVYAMPWTEDEIVKFCLRYVLDPEGEHLFTVETREKADYVLEGFGDGSKADRPRNCLGRSTMETVVLTLGARRPDFI